MNRECVASGQAGQDRWNVVTVSQESDYWLCTHGNTPMIFNKIIGIHTEVEAWSWSRLRGLIASCLRFMNHLTNRTTL